MTPDELVSATAGTINGLGARFYFDPATLADGKERGLDGFRYYVLGRGGVLGDVEPAVVASAFGYFHRDLVAKMWNSARETMAPRDAGRAYLACNAELGRAHLGDVAGLDDFCAAAERAIDQIDPSALALYAATAAEPLPQDLAGRAMQLVVVHRELRGSLHLAAIVAAGLDPSVAHAIRRPDDVAMFGHGEGIEIPDGAADTLADIDATTDRLHALAYAGLTDEERASFAAGTAAIDAAFAATA